MFPRWLLALVVAAQAICTAGAVALWRIHPQTNYATLAAVEVVILAAAIVASVLASRIRSPF